MNFIGSAPTVLITPAEENRQSPDDETAGEQSTQTQTSSEK